MEAVAEGRVERDDRVIPGERPDAIGPLGDRQAQKYGVGEEADETDGDRILPASPEDQPRPEGADAEARQRARIEACQERQVEPGAEVEPDNRLKEQAWDREALGELHQKVHTGIAEIAAPDGHIAKSDDDEDRQDDGAEDRHSAPRHGPISITIPSKAGVM